MSVLPSSPFNSNISKSIDPTKIQAHIRGYLTRAALSLQKQMDCLHKQLDALDPSKTESLFTRIHASLNSMGSISNEVSFLKCVRNLIKAHTDHLIKNERENNRLPSDTKEQQTENPLKENQHFGTKTFLTQLERILLVSSSEEHPPNLEFEVTEGSDMGGRKLNEDACLNCTIPEGKIFGVFDGHKDKGVLAELVAKELKENFSAALKKCRNDPKKALETLLLSIHERIKKFREEVQRKRLSYGDIGPLLEKHFLSYKKNEYESLLIEWSLKNHTLYSNYLIPIHKRRTELIQIIKSNPALTEDVDTLFSKLSNKPSEDLKSEEKEYIQVYTELKKLKSDKTDKNLPAEVKALKSKVGQYYLLSGRTTAIVCFVDKNGLCYTATCGDSEAFLVSKKHQTIIALSPIRNWHYGWPKTKEHPPQKDFERWHQENKRELLKFWRKNELSDPKNVYSNDSGINVSRSIGDYLPVIPKPKVSVIQLNPEDELTLCCDGVTDYVDLLLDKWSQNIPNQTQGLIDFLLSDNVSANKIIELAKRWKTKDNVTAVHIKVRSKELDSN